MERPLVMFDFDGVLADSLEMFEGLVKISLSRLGFDAIRTREDFLALFDDNLYVSLGKLGLSQEDMIENFKFIDSRVDFGSIGLYDGIKQALGLCQGSARTAIVSSNKEYQIKQILNANDASGFFELVLGFESGISKVNKLKKAMAHFGAAPSDTYYIVDTAGDLREARESGVLSVAVGWGWHGKDRLMAESPSYFIEDTEKLATFLRKICKDQ